MEMVSTTAKKARKEDMSASQTEYSMGEIDDEKISFTNIERNDTVLFLPTPSGDFGAFNHGCPNRFLSKDCLQLSVSNDPRPHYVIGKVFFLLISISSICDWW